MATPGPCTGYAPVNGLQMYDWLVARVMSFPDAPLPEAT